MTRQARRPSIAVFPFLAAWMLIGCDDHDRREVVSPDSEPPASPSAFKALPEDRRVELLWNNPTVSDFAGVMVVRKSEHAPNMPSDGVEVYRGTDTEASDSHVENDVSYHYAIYAFDQSGNWSAPAQAATVPVAATLRHGVWVYRAGDWIRTQTGPDDFMDFVQRFGINDVYLSIGHDLLSNPALPGFLSRLYKDGVRVEALTSNTEKIQEVIAYNDSRSRASQRFRGVHLDIEPWIGSGYDLSWVTPLTHTYQQAAHALEGTSMVLVADMSGSKIRHATRSQRQAMLDSVKRLVLMQYEVGLSTVELHTDQFLADLDVTGHERGVIVAIRAVDFSRVLSKATRLDANYAGNKGYGGWSIFDYDRAR